MLHMIVEQTYKYPMRMEYDSETGTFHAREYKSLQYERGFTKPYGWIKESGTPPQPHRDGYMLPTSEEAERLLKEAEGCNPGPWGNHSRVAAHCAEKIAEACGDMDSEKAYILGLLHDIGRKFGTRHMGHVSDGYSYMLSLGYDEAAQICLTHSFKNRTTADYVGKFDTTEEELKMIEDNLKIVEMDDYDLLIQLCDAIAGTDGVMNIEDRMNDVKRRYGGYSQVKWDANMALKKRFEDKMGKDIYTVVEKDTFKP